MLNGIEETNFNSISAYVTYVLEQILSKKDISQEYKKGFSDKEEKEVKKRLEKLGVNQSHNNQQNKPCEVSGNSSQP